MSEVDRAQFEKQQLECITKAIKNEEVPAKEKHVRRAIIGTWQEQGNSMFWTVLGRQPLPSQAVTCWKSLTVMHKIFQEGHTNVLKDSYVYRKTLRDLFSVYRFQAGVYGPLICEYLKILQTKLEMHHKYPGIPGGLTSTRENPVKLPERDINNLFTFGVECLDYKDLLLSLEENIFKTLDKSKNNSEIASSQCRIAVLVPVLKECSGIYDLLVQTITKLHKSLPHDSLDGHRQRFYEQHKRLRVFCFEAGTLQYVRNLTSIPDIPDNPPNFLIHKYRMKHEPAPPPQKEEPIVPITPQVDERDILIEQLMREIDELRLQLEATQRESLENEKKLKLQILKLQEEYKRLEEITLQLKRENNFLKDQMESVGKEDTDAQEKVKSADEKFNKLKVLYGKLRQEHIELLRKNAEIKQSEEATLKKFEELEEKIKVASVSVQERENEIDSLKEKIKELESSNQNLKISFDQSDEASKSEIGTLLGNINDMEKLLEDSKSKSKELEDRLERLTQDSEKQIRSLRDQLDQLTTGKITEETARKSAEDAINKLRMENEQTKENLEKLLSDTEKKLSEEEAARKKLENELNSLNESSDSQISLLNGQLKDCQSRYEDELSNKKRLEQELNNLKNESSEMNKNLSDKLDEWEKSYSTEAAERKRLEDELSRTMAEFQAQIASLTSSLENTEKAKQDEELLRKTAEANIIATQDKNKADLADLDKAKTEELWKQHMDLLANAAQECEDMIKETIDLFSDVTHESGTTCTPEYLKSRLTNLPDAVKSTTSQYASFNDTHQGITRLVNDLHRASHHISDALINGKATSHMASPEESKTVVGSCKDAGQATLSYLQQIKTNADVGSVNEGSHVLEEKIRNMIRVTEDLISKQSDTGDVDNIVDEEMHATEKVVADAAARIEEMLNKSRKHHSGVQLEVNERILDSCTSLMKAIRELILKSKDLQDEIVSDGKGSASVKEFYKRHHKWTEGLLSAAKSVGWGATILVDSADKVVERKGKFEELVVASHEIAASTAQLVAASRVKATKNSKKLPPLMTASRGVGEATAGVVAAVRSGASMTEESKTVPNYSKMTLTQAKRLEMDSQVKVLELEDQLQKERTKLGNLRKAHYQLAVDLYGEEQVNMPG